MLVDRLAFHMCINAAQNGGFEVFFAERYYEEENELYSFIKKSGDYKQARAIVMHWLKKAEKENG